MAKGQGRPNGKATKRPTLKYFFLNEELHVKLHINRGKDQMVAWNYAKGCKMTYTYSDVVRRYKRAFTTTEICTMLGRNTKFVINEALKRGDLEYPQYTYSFETKKLHKYMWQEKEVLNLLDCISNVHQGRPRKDGLITNNHLPTPREVRAMMNDMDSILYVKQGDTFVPSWKAKELD